MNWLMVFMVVCTYPVLLIMYYVMRQEAKPRANLRFGVTIPGAYLEDDKMLSVVEQYKRRLKIYGIFLAILPIPIFWISYFSIAFTVWIFWMYALIILMELPYLLANKKTIRLKKENYWQFSEQEAGADAEDKYWKWGMFYYNPQEKNGFVTSRVGIGQTANMAKTWAKVLIGFSVVLCLSMLPLSAWIVAEEFTPVYLKLENGEVVAGQLRDNYRIDQENIETVELLTEVPGMSKKVGTAMDTVKKGEYHIRNVGDCDVLYNPQNQYVIYIRCAGSDYYFGDADDAQTMEIYEQLRAKEN